jgi:ornithine--oxo-acid transaminase
MSQHDYLAEVDRYSAHNYHPLPLILSRGEGAWVWDVDGNKYLDCLAAYSALNQGHRHPAIVQAAKEQIDRLTLTSRAFHNDQMGPFLRELCELSGYEKALPMNSGAEAVETAIKAVRRWGYRVKGIPSDQAEIIVCENNFHGRTTSWWSRSKVKAASSSRRKGSWRRPRRSARTTTSSSSPMRSSRVLDALERCSAPSGKT